MVDTARWDLNRISSWMLTQIQYPEDAYKYHTAGIEQLCLSVAWDGRVFVSSRFSTLNPAFEREIERVVRRAPRCNTPLLDIEDANKYMWIDFYEFLPEEKRRERLDQLFRQQPPAVIVGRSEELEPFPEMLELAKKHGVALLRSNETTCTLMGSLISVLNLELAPRITRHGVLVEVYGEGILILGDSGVGKSETAIELVKRGHRLVADDAVELRKVSNRQIMGTAPENIRHFIELRGIGIVNVARVFGVGAVKESESLDLVVQLEAWDPTKNYQRTGLESEYYDILGVNIPSTIIPVSPGRNLAVVLETAAINNRQKKMGYNAAKELLIRLGLNDTMD